MNVRAARERLARIKSHKSVGSRGPADQRQNPCQNQKPPGFSVVQNQSLSLRRDGLLSEHQIGLLQNFFDSGQERGGRRAVGDAMVEGEAKVHHRTDSGDAGDGNHRIHDGANTQNGGLRRDDNGIELRDADGTVAPLADTKAAPANEPAAPAQPAKAV